MSRVECELLKLLDKVHPNDPRCEDCLGDECTGKKCAVINADQSGFNGPADPDTCVVACIINALLSGTYYTPGIKKPIHFD